MAISYHSERLQFVRSLSWPVVIILSLITLPTVIEAADASRDYTVGVAYILTRPDAALCGTYQDAKGAEMPELSRIVRRKDTRISVQEDGRKIRGPIVLKSSRRTCCQNGVCAYPKPNVFVD